MAGSFFFYDLETSGFDPKFQRIMQFAGQRTDFDLRPIGDPVNILIRLTPDVLPDPDAIMVTGITPQATLADGMTEAEFLKFFYAEICKPETTFLGYNSVRFDDEFMRHLLYRNFYDAYEWQWWDGCSRWDMLDVVRMTRALRPEGIKWPFASDGAPSNQLSLVTSVNGLDHENAHDAESDVGATIAVAKLIKTTQPRLFQYLFEMRDKRRVAELVNRGEPFVYTSGSYPSETGKTTIVCKITDLPNGQGALVYDLRHDPKEYMSLPTEELKQRMSWQPRGVERKPWPVKAIRYNRCPAIAPLSVLDAASQGRLQINTSQIHEFQKELAAATDFIQKVQQTYQATSDRRVQSTMVTDEQTVDGQLYDGFLSDSDRKRLQTVRTADTSALSGLHDGFEDRRLQALLPLYKARNYPETLDGDERTAWELFCQHRLLDGGPKSRAAKYFERLQSLANQARLTQQQKYLLEELQLYAESIMPFEP